MKTNKTQRRVLADLTTCTWDQAWCHLHALGWDMSDEAYDAIMSADGDDYGSDEDTAWRSRLISALDKQRQERAATATKQRNETIHRLFWESEFGDGHATTKLAGFIDGFFRRGMFEEQILEIFEEAIGVDLDWNTLADTETWGIEWRKIQRQERDREIEAANGDWPDDDLMSLHLRWDEIVADRLSRA